MSERRRRFRKFRIFEISGVDRPMQEHASFVLLKRQESPVRPSADDVATSKERSMSEDLKAQMETLQKSLAQAEAIAGMTDRQKIYFKSLNASDQQAFLDADSDFRDSLIAKAEEQKNASDPVVYKTADGLEIRKSDGQAVLHLAKRADAEAKRVETLTAENAELKKVAEEVGLKAEVETILGCFPGDISTRVEILRAAKSVDAKNGDTKAVDALKAQNEKMGSAFKQIGISRGPKLALVEDDRDSASQKFEDSIRALMKEKSLSYVQAANEFGRSREGKALYAKAHGEVA